MGFTAGVLVGLVSFDLLPEIFRLVYTLHLDDCGITDAGLLTVGRLRTLKSLFLRCPRLTDDGLKMLSDLRSLKVRVGE